MIQKWWRIFSQNFWSIAHTPGLFKTLSIIQIYSKHWANIRRNSNVYFVMKTNTNIYSCSSLPRQKKSFSIGYKSHHILPNGDTSCIFFYPSPSSKSSFWVAYHRPVLSPLIYKGRCFLFTNCEEPSWYKQRCQPVFGGTHDGLVNRRKTILWSRQHPPKTLVKDICIYQRKAKPKILSLVPWSKILVVSH